MSLLVGGVLLLLASLLFVVVAPAVDCPECNGGRSAIFTLQDASPNTVTAGCPTCDGKSRVTLIQKWKYRKAEEARTAADP